MRLYHFTSKARFAEIFASRVLKRTASSLAKPVNLHRDYERGAIVADNDDYRPVVWLTASPVVTLADLGLSEGADEEMKLLLGDSKTSVRLTFNKTPEMQRWTRWAKDNQMDEDMFKLFKRTSKDTGNWYICEKEIPFSECAEVKIDGVYIDDFDSWLDKYRIESERLSQLNKARFEAAGISLEGKDNINLTRAQLRKILSINPGTA